MDNIKIKQMMEMDFKKYAWYCFCIENSSWMGLAKYSNMRTNNNQLIRRYLNDREFIPKYYNTRNKVKLLENDKSKLKGQQVLLKKCNSKLAELETIVFILNAFLIKIEPNEAKIFKNNKGSKDECNVKRYVNIMVKNVFPSKVYYNVLSSQYISKMPIKTEINKSDIQKATQWLTWTVFGVNNEKTEWGKYYYWAINYIFKISLVIDISKNITCLYNMVQNDIELVENSKQTLKKILKENEDFIIIQLAKFSRSPFEKTNSHYVNYECTMLFDKLKFYVLECESKKTNIVEENQFIFIDWKKQIDKRVDSINKAYDKEKEKIQESFSFCVQLLSDTIKLQLQDTCDLIVNSGSGRKVISSSDVRRSMDKLISEVEERLNLSYFSACNQLLNELRKLKSDILNNIDYTKNKHKEKKKISNIFLVHLKKCTDILSEMYTLECSLGFENLECLDNNDEKKMTLKKVVEEYFCTSKKGKIQLEKREVKIFAYIYKCVNAYEEPITISQMNEKFLEMLQKKPQEMSSEELQKKLQGKLKVEIIKRKKTNKKEH